MWSRIKYEEEMVPSDGALEQHWLRACWVLAIWRQASSNNITYPPLYGNGWKQTSSNTLEIEWDSEDYLTRVRVRTNVALIRKGCGCKTGCTTSRCKCRKGGADCGPGCKCQGCTKPASNLKRHFSTIIFSVSTSS